MRGWVWSGDRAPLSRQRRERKAPPGGSTAPPTVTTAARQGAAAGRQCVLQRGRLFRSWSPQQPSLGRNVRVTTLNFSPPLSNTRHTRELETAKSTALRAATGQVRDRFT